MLSSAPVQLDVHRRELPDAQAFRLPRSTTALAEARLERMEIRVVILTSVEALISGGVTSMRPACRWLIFCLSKSSDVEDSITVLEKLINLLGKDQIS